MPARFLPNTDVGRSDALGNGCDKYSSTPLDERAVSEALFNSVVAVRTPWDAANRAMANAAVAQKEAVEEAEALGKKLEQYCAHFLQVFNLGVARGTFPVSARGFYEMEMTQNTLPALASHNDRKRWADRIVKGEADRAAAEGEGTAVTYDSGVKFDSGITYDSTEGGYIPMALPSADEVEDLLAEYLAAHQEASNLKTAFDRAQEAVQNLRPTVDPVIVELWDNIEFFFRHDEPSSLRRKAREWGVVYITRPGETPDPDEPPTPPAPTPPTPPNS